MSITVVSSTEPKEAAAPNEESLAQNQSVDETKSASAPENADETSEESDPSNEETQELDGNDESEAQDEDKKPKKQNGFKKRIDKLNSRLTAKEQEIEYWKQQALKGPAPKQESAPNESLASAKNDSRPKEDDFNSHAEYIEALTDWKIEDRERAKEAKAKQAEAKSSIEKQVSTHLERVESFKKSHDDFDEVIADVDDVPMSIAVQEVILSSDNGPALMYELAKNRAEFERISKLPAIAAALELGKIVSKIASTSESSNQKPEVKTTKAPTPIKPVGSKTGVVKKTIYDPNLSQGEYEAMRAEQLRRA